MPVDPSWEGFIERVLERLHRLRHTKADVLIQLGRIDKQTGEKIPPKISHREFD